MRHVVLVVIFAATLVGCAHAGRNPLAPVAPGGDQGAHASRLHPELTDLAALAVDRDERYRLLGEWTFFISADRDRVDVVPRRDMHFHLNALRFLEEYCKNCLQITGIKNNGDSTIDLTVRITHPFKGFPQYTGFDVKGIIMFNGSWEHEGYLRYPPWPEPFRVSWRKLGDPQVLNPDGYTLRWSPWYDSGRPEPIFNYWPGRYARGAPSANVNAYLNFYTDENRHMFRDDGVVTRTYHVWLPPGEPVVAAYAVEACWEPPINTPVTDPASDFPSTANQEDAYEFYYILNNGQPITDPDCCGGDPGDPGTGYIVWKNWTPVTYPYGYVFAYYTEHSNENGWHWPPCGDEWPDQYCAGDIFQADHFPDGDFIGVAIGRQETLYPSPQVKEGAYTVFEFTIDLE